jgi:DNA-binding NtrC family response regulator
MTIEQSTILIVEDEDLMRGILVDMLSDAGMRIIEAASGEQALELYAAESPALTITDIALGRMDGIELLTRIKQIDEEALVVMITAYSSVETAIAALRKGAYDYITKPFINEDILQTVHNALRQRDLFRENRYLRRELKQKYNFDNIIGRSDSLIEIFKLIEKIAATNSSVLIQGESGTGKELIARAIHYNSPRTDGPFIPINCGALPENLLESELFGYVKGAFTGANSNKTGLLKAAHSGTLFLDELSEMPMPLQVKLLRVIQEREFIPLGSTRLERFDARIITATNRNLEEECAAGRFREDLYYRLSVFNLTIPPLRDRREDIPLLVRFFVEKHSRSLNQAPKAVSDETMQALLSHEWRGNIRELQNAIERAVTLADDRIELHHLPQKVRSASADIRDLSGQTITLDELEKRHIFETLDRVDDDKARAAALLGIDLSTLYRKLKRYER